MHHRPPPTVPEDLSVPALRISPAVFHQVHHDLVQQLLHEGCADPEVSQGLRRDVGRLGLPAAVVGERGVVVFAEERTEMYRTIYQKDWKK